MMKKNLFLVVVAMIMMLASTNVSAQDTTISKEYKEAIGKMLKASGALTSAETMLPQIVNMMKQSSAGIPDAFWDDFMAKCKAKFADRLAELYTPIYHKYLTLDDVNQLIAFYETPIGKKMGEVVPKVTMEGMQLGQKLGQEIVQEIQKEKEAKGYK